MTRRLGIAAASAAALLTTAHIGTNDVVLDTHAGPWPVRVVIRPAGVVPGLAQLSVRVLDGHPSAVTAQAAPASMGTRAAPPPDTLRPVPGEAGHHAGELWLMTAGGYVVRVEVVGNLGRGTLLVPVQSVATRRLAMTRTTGWLLGVAGCLLLIGAVTIVRASLRDAVREPGEPLTGARIAAGRRATLVGTVVMTLLVLGGWRWWRAEDAAYARTIETPLATEVSADSAQLRIRVTDPRWASLHRSLIPDHGKMMHLFLVRTPDQAAFAHLHPVRGDSASFVTPLPALPHGRYRVFADVVHDDGLTRTLRADVTLPPRGPAGVPLDPDDSWVVGAPARPAGAAGPLVATLAGGGSMVWERAGSLVAGPETSLRVLVRDAAGSPMPLEPYMGMTGHAIVMRHDGGVFVHLHPAGTVSLGAQQRLAEEAGLAPTHGPSMHTLADQPGVVRFPFAFPSPGRYVIWVQVKSRGRIETGVFDTQVLAAGSPLR